MVRTEAQTLSPTSAEAPPRILLVEDEAAARAALTALLEGEGYELRSAADGEAALAALQGWSPDVVITDVRMPRMGGIALMERLAAVLPGVPVIVMTALASVEHAVDTLHLGAADYLAKPVDFARLLAALRRVLARAGAPLRPGEVIGGRYRIEAKLGAGAMGAVYRATQLSLERPVALKVLSVRGEVADARARLLREARVASSLHHPGVVQIHDVGEDLGRPFLVMELLTGRELREEVGFGAPPMPLPRLLRIAREIADVLVATHAIGLVHRDLKPDNIFLEETTGGERVRILDFGLAFLADRPARESGRITAEGMIIGTPHYIAPEQAADLAVGPAADIYALGCVLYEMATGEPPFDGQGVEVMASHLNARPPAPDARRPELPPALSALCVAMLAKAPAERPAAAQVAATLTRLIDEVEAPPPRVVTIDPEETTIRGQIIAPFARPRVLVAGSRAAGLSAALVAAGAAPEPLVDPARQLAGAACVVALDLPLTDVARLARLPVPVIVDVAPGDGDREAALRGLGVAVIVRRPVDADVLARALAQIAGSRGQGAR